MKNVVYETLNRQGQLVVDGEILIVKSRSLTTKRFQTIVVSNTFLLNSFIKWVDWNLVDKPQGVWCTPFPTLETEMPG